MVESAIKVYCDGFMHWGDWWNGCSVAVKNGDDFTLSRLEFTDLQSSRINNFINSYPITNNVVEYFALYSALFVAGQIPADRRVYVFSDSMLVVNQFNEGWSINHDHLRIWHYACWERKTPNTSVIWTNRKNIVKVLGH